MNISQIRDTITPLITTFEELGITYYIGGSVVSSVYGILRATFDIDIIADLRLAHITPLVKRLEKTYYIDADMIKDAIQHRSEFNIIHLDTMLKVDIFIPKLRAFDQEEMRRVQQKTLVKGERLFNLASPEGTILNKLEWYRMGSEVSDRQWNDILGVLKVRGTSLDMAYLQRWAANLQVTDLLERALIDAGLRVDENSDVASLRGIAGSLKEPLSKQHMKEIAYEDRLETNLPPEQENLFDQ